jgi:hypothetical protein
VNNDNHQANLCYKAMQLFILKTRLSEMSTPCWLYLVKLRLASAQNMASLLYPFLAWSYSLYHWSGLRGKKQESHGFLPFIEWDINEGFLVKFSSKAIH